MRWTLTLMYMAILVTAEALPAAATVHAAMYCWVPDFEIAIACDDDDDGGGDGDDSARAPVPPGTASQPRSSVEARSSVENGDRVN
jgi:hypothetical protein